MPDWKLGPKVAAYGPTRAQVVVVGEAPGADEERQGQPFVGAAGKLLKGLLMQQGINPNDVLFTNLCKYRPPGNDFSAFLTTDGMPNDLVFQGLTELKDEISQASPNLIIALGNNPLKFLTGHGKWDRSSRGYTGITDWRGSLCEGSPIVGGRKVLPTFHPAYLLRQYRDTAIVRVDLARAARERAFPELRRPVKELILDPRGPTRSMVEDRLLSDRSRIITGDIEFIGSRLLCLGVTNGSDWAASVRITDAADLAWCKRILESGAPLCFQNAMFDCAILDWHYGIDCYRNLAYDTMIAAHAAYIELPKDLGFLTSIYTDQPYYKDMVRWKDVAAGIQPLETVLHYNAIDTWVTHAIMEAQQSDELLDSSVRWTFDHEMSLIPVLWEISKRGVRVDLDRLVQLRETLESEAATLGAGLRLLAGRDINVKSRPQVAELLFSSLGVPVGAKTPGGAYKTDDRTLADLYSKCRDDKQRNAIKIIRELRERRDLISKFCDIEWDDDGRMRCMYDPAKTDTGRLSSKKFFPTGKGTNNQNVPQDKRVRAIICADPGMEFAYADLERAESLVVAHITGDPEMLRIHSPEIDAHKHTASYLFGKPVDQITDDERYLGKRVRHASNYMMGPRMLQTIINADAQKTGVSITFAEAKTLIDKYRSLHPYLLVWWRKVERELLATRTLYTLLGRKRVFYDRPDSTLPNAIAFIPQGTVGDLLNIGLRASAKDSVLRGLGYQQLLQVHDAIGFQYPQDNRVQVLRRCRELMSVPLRADANSPEFTIPVEIKIGQNWGELSLWKDEALAA